jgi:flagellar basal-body rod modification protein FlgD
MPTPVGGGAASPASLHGSVDSAMTALGGLDSEGFLNLLVAQLRYQSPLEPSDPGDLMTQTAALAQLDATQQLLATQQRDLALQQAVAAAGLLGLDVSAVDDDGQPVDGIVDGIRYSAVGPILDVGGTQIHLGNVLEVRRTEAADPSTTTAAFPSGLIADDPSTPSGLIAGPTE